MGFKYFSDGNYSPLIGTKSPNPNPKRFIIKNIKQFGTTNPVSVVYVNYPDCTTFEGNKILVIKATVKEISIRTELDPHFYDGCKSLLARFPATIEGQNDAELYAIQKSS